MQADESLSEFEQPKDYIPIEEHSALQFAEREAKVSEAIQPSQEGRVKFQGSEWSAKSLTNVTLLPGRIVKVIGVQSNTLVVGPQ
ncbi:MAG: NfeD family protein [Spirulinaceae cyanobacterium]